MRGFFPFPFGCAQGQGQNDNINMRPRSDGGQQKGPLAVCASAGLWKPGVSLATSPDRTLPPTRAAHGDGGALDAATNSSSFMKLPAGRGFVNARAADDVSLSRIRQMRGFFAALRMTSKNRQQREARTGNDAIRRFWPAARMTACVWGGKPCP